MKRIKLTQGKVALVDDKDFEWLGQWKWYASKLRHTYYAARHLNKKSGGKTILMHREILKLNQTKILTDHIDKNGLNNQKHNLRKCTYSENNANRSVKINSTSKYLGIYYFKQTKKWKATINKNKKIIHLGYFNNEVDAAKVYDKAAIKYHGEFASLNFKQTWKINQNPD